MKSEKIKVFVRIRPMTEKERVINEVSTISFGNLPHSITHTNPTTLHEKKTYAYTGIWEEHSTQTEIFKEMIPLLEDVLHGYSVTVLAYGQTGSGKTHSMIGGKDIHQGLAPRVINYLFQRLEEINLKEVNVNANAQSNSSKQNNQIQANMFEIYNEKITDLISHKSGLRVLQKKEGFVVSDAKYYESKTAGEMEKVLYKGLRDRRESQNEKHYHSSRSHCIFSMIVKLGDVRGIINLVDLAGSEYAADGGGGRQETKCINQSLLSLKKVLRSLITHKSHIEYNESVLTKVLKSSIGGYSRTLMIATISPSSVDFVPTRSTLIYAQIANRITNNPITNEADPKDAYIKIMKEFHNKLERLKQGLEDGTINESELPQGIHLSENHSEKAVLKLVEEMNISQISLDEKNKLLKLLEVSNREKKVQKQKELKDLQDKYLEQKELKTKLIEDNKQKHYDVLYKGTRVLKQIINLTRFHVLCRMIFSQEIINKIKRLSKKLLNNKYEFIKFYFEVDPIKEVKINPQQSKKSLPNKERIEGILTNHTKTKDLGDLRKKPGKLKKYTIDDINKIYNTGNTPSEAALKLMGDEPIIRSKEIEDEELSSNDKDRVDKRENIVLGDIDDSIVVFEEYNSEEDNKEEEEEEEEEEPELIEFDDILTYQPIDKNVREKLINNEIVEKYENEGGLEEEDSDIYIDMDDLEELDENAQLMNDLKELEAIQDDDLLQEIEPSDYDDSESWLYIHLDDLRKDNAIHSPLFETDGDPIREIIISYIKYLDSYSNDVSEQILNRKGFNSDGVGNVARDEISEIYFMEILAYIQPEPQFPDNILLQMKENCISENIQEVTQRSLGNCTRDENEAILCIELYIKDSDFGKDINSGLIDDEFLGYFQYLRNILWREEQLARIYEIPQEFVWRGTQILNDDLNYSYQVNQTYFWPHLTSTSLTKDNALDFMKFCPNNEEFTPILFCIKLDINTKFNKYYIAPNSSHAGEEEVLLLPYFEFSVLDKKIVVDGDKKIVLIYLQEISSSYYGKPKIQDEITEDNKFPDEYMEKQISISEVAGKKEDKEEEDPFMIPEDIVELNPFVPKIIKMIIPKLLDPFAYIDIEKLRMEENIFDSPLLEAVNRLIKDIIVAYINIEQSPEDNLISKDKIFNSKGFKKNEIGNYVKYEISKIYEDNILCYKEPKGEFPNNILEGMKENNMSEMQEIIKKFLSKLRKKENESICCMNLYTRVGNFQRRINKGLVNDEFQAYYEYLHSLLWNEEQLVSLYSCIPQDNVWRGTQILNVDLAHFYQVNQTYFWPHFTSTSIRKEIAVHFIKHSTNDLQFTPILFCIQLNDTTKCNKYYIPPISYRKGEPEVLLFPYFEFIVLDKKIFVDGDKNVALIYLQECSSSHYGKPIGREEEKIIEYQPVIRDPSVIYIEDLTGKSKDSPSRQMLKTSSSHIQNIIKEYINKLHSPGETLSSSIVFKSKGFKSDGIGNFVRYEISEIYNKQILSYIQPKPQFPDTIFREMEINKISASVQTITRKTLSNLRINEEAVKLINLYTKASNFYGDLNRSLANDLFEGYYEYLRNLLWHEGQLTSSFVNIPQDSIWRGTQILNEDLDKSYQVNQTYFWPNMASTSLEKNIAVSFIQYSKSTELFTPILFCIELDRTTKFNKYFISSISEFENEAEVLLLPYFQFIVIDKKPLKEGNNLTLLIHIKEVKTSYYGKRAIQPRPKYIIPNQPMTVRVPLVSFSLETADTANISDNFRDLAKSIRKAYSNTYKLIEFTVGFNDGLPHCTTDGLSTHYLDNILSYDQPNLPFPENILMEMREYNIPKHIVNIGKTSLSKYSQEMKNKALMCIYLYTRNNYFYLSINKRLVEDNLIGFQQYLRNILWEEKQLLPFTQMPQRLVWRGYHIERSDIDELLYDNKVYFWPQFSSTSITREESINFLLCSEEIGNKIPILFCIELDESTKWNKYVIYPNSGKKKDTQVLLLPYFQFTIKSRKKTKNDYADVMMVDIKEVSSNYYGKEEALKSKYERELRERRAREYQERLRKEEEDNRKREEDLRRKREEDLMRKRKVEDKKIKELEDIMIKKKKEEEDKKIKELEDIMNKKKLEEMKRKEEEERIRMYRMYGLTYIYVEDLGMTLDSPEYAIMGSPIKDIILPYIQTLHSNPTLSPNKVFHSLGFKSDGIGNFVRFQISSIYYNEILSYLQPKPIFPHNILEQMHKNNIPKNIQDLTNSTLSKFKKDEDEARLCVNLYTMESEFYGDLNRSLANDKFEGYYEYLRNMLWKEEQLASQYSDIPQDNVWRGTQILNEDLLRSYQVNKTYFWPHFTSTSLRKEIAVNFIRHSTNDQQFTPILFCIQLDNTTKYNKYYIADISCYKSEAEVLMLPYFQFIVEDKKIIKEKKGNKEFVLLHIKESKSNYYGKRLIGNPKYFPIQPRKPDPLQIITFDSLKHNYLNPDGTYKRTSKDISTNFLNILVPLIKPPKEYNYKKSVKKPFEFSVGFNDRVPFHIRTEISHTYTNKILTYEQPDSDSPFPKNISDEMEIYDIPQNILKMTIQELRNNTQYRDEAVRCIYLYTKSTWFSQGINSDLAKDEFHGYYEYLRSILWNEKELAPFSNIPHKIVWRGSTMNKEDLATIYNHTTYYFPQFTSTSITQEQATKYVKHSKKGGSTPLILCIELDCNTKWNKYIIKSNSGNSADVDTQVLLFPYFQFQIIERKLWRDNGKEVILLNLREISSSYYGSQSRAESRMNLYKTFDSATQERDENTDDENTIVDLVEQEIAPELSADEILGGNKIIIHFNFEMTEEYYRKNCSLCKANSNFTHEHYGPSYKFIKTKDHASKVLYIYIYIYYRKEHVLLVQSFKEITMNRDLILIPRRSP